MITNAMHNDKNIDITNEMLESIFCHYGSILDLPHIVKIKKQLAKATMKGLVKQMKYRDVLNYIADDCILKSSYGLEYGKIASHICIDMLHHDIPEDYLTCINSLYESDIISDELHDIVNKYHETIQKQFKFDRDYNLSYFGIKTLERSYLLKLRKGETKIVERPQHLFMRVALGIHSYDLDKAFETYNYMSDKYMIHATPTLFNAGTKRPQMSSCFLLHMDDSIEGIFDTIGDIGKISKWAGGIGVSLSDIRGKGSLIKGTNGISDGIVPLCKLLNVEGNYINQGGKRNGSIAVYLEPWHTDIYDFCALRTNTKNNENKARDLFMGLWIPDLFMERVRDNGVWSLMCPNECKGLTDVYGDAFKELYVKYETEGKYKKQIQALDLWVHIMTCQIETGMPYMLYKDACNKKSNQQNIGTIKCSNLCSEIVEYTDNENISVCNLASICLPRFIEDGKFNFDKLSEISKILVNNLDIIIDKNFYPVDKAFNSNIQHRPIGVGVQGLADVYNILRLPFESEEARELNKNIFKCIYYSSVRASCDLAKSKGTYGSFNGSPFSQGKMQFDLWDRFEECEELREDIKKYGMRNSLLTTCMPTASTSQIMGYSECIEPNMSNIYTRKTLAGEFIVVNENLMKELINLKIWNNSIRTKLIVFNGSLEHIDEIPDDIKKIYKTAFDTSLKSIIQQSIDRGIYIDQSQSLNLFMEKADFERLTNAHFYGWKYGLKTGMYYLRSRPSIDPLQFGVDPNDIQDIKNKKAKLMCKLNRDIGLVSECLLCSS